ncbi:MAG: DUF3576 domain-containing protein [Dongiaceae bacterium]
MPRFAASFSALLLICLFTLSVTACGSVRKGTGYTNETDAVKRAQSGGSVLGDEGGFLAFGKSKAKDQGAVGIGVNSYLWRAALDTVSFMPLSSADPFGGVIITDWYTPPETPEERFKVTVYILTRELRSDGIKVAAFRQISEGQGGWKDAPVEPKTATELENTILKRARQLRIASGAK